MIILSIAASKILIFIHFNDCKGAEKVSSENHRDIDVPVVGDFSFLTIFYFALLSPFASLAGGTFILKMISETDIVVLRVEAATTSKCRLPGFSQNHASHSEE